MDDFVSRIGPLAEYARRVDAVGPGCIEPFLLKNRSVTGRDVLAVAASSGALRAEDLVLRLRHLARGGSPSARRFVRGLKPVPLLALARVLANQGFLPTDRLDALTIYRLVLEHHGMRMMKREDRLIMTEILSRTAPAQEVHEHVERFRVRRSDPYHGHLLQANATNPFDNVDLSEDVWLRHVNAMYFAEGIEPISMAPGLLDPFDRILSGAGETVWSGSKITVVVPTYNSGPRIATAMYSLLGQSWTNLEILIMDDCSPPSNDKYLRRFEEMDSRVRVVKLVENRGTYFARNVAMAEHASGEFLTVHDDDDWSHPRKLETQAAHLLANPDDLANVSLLSRATANLSFVRINGNPLFLQRNFSSLMFRREAVVTELGYWDEINRSGDAEFYDRMVAYTGRPVPAVGRAAMSLLRVREGSLTSGEIVRGYFDARRLWYQGAYRRWHKKAVAEDRGLRLDRDNGLKRKFAAPEGMKGSRLNRPAVHVDVLYVTDFRFPGGNSSLSAAEIHVLLQMGLRVGLMQLDSPLNGWASILHEKILALADHDNAVVVSVLDDVEARTTVVRHPTTLQFAPAVRRTNLRTSKVVVIVNHAPAERDGTGSLYDMSRVLSNAEVIFGCPILVSPESGIIRSELSGLVPASSLTDFDWQGLVPLDPSQQPRVHPGDRALVMGRHGRDHPLKWPSGREIEMVYPVDGSVRVRILGGAEVPVRLLGMTPQWEVHGFNAVPPSEFLSMLDFWVYFHNEQLIESFGIATAEAMAAGLVVILPEYMEPTFGDAAVYAAPQEVAATLHKYWDDADLYEAQSARALSYVRQHLSAAALMERILWLADEE